MGEIAPLPTGDRLALDDIGSAWVRKGGSFSYRSELSPQERAYANAETEHVLLGLLYSLDCFWMSHPAAIRGATWKPEQLRRASRLGFNTPETLLTTSPASVRSFSREAPAIIFKPLSSPYLAAEAVHPDQRTAGILTTTLLTDDHMRSLDAISEVPCFFQAYVPKAHEWRVTIVDDVAYAVRIDSQADARTMIDSRSMSAEIEYRAERLPVLVEERCRALIRSYGLTFGAIDLITTPSGDHVFLENNPQGQFLYVNQLVPELRLVDAVANRLVMGDRKS